MPVRFLSGTQRRSLAGFPSELDAAVLKRFFALGPADLSEVRRRRSAPNRLGWALQLCALRMLGFRPEDVWSAPEAAVAFVARQLGVVPDVLAAYGHRAHTRQDHAGQVPAYLGFRLADVTELEELSVGVVTRAEGWAGQPRTETTSATLQRTCPRRRSKDKEATWRTPFIALQRTALIGRLVTTPRTAKLCAREGLLCARSTADKTNRSG